MAKYRTARDRMRAIVTDALKYWRRNKAKPARCDWGTTERCCLLSAAYLNCHREEYKTYETVDRNKVEWFVRQRYGLTPDQVDQVVYGFDLPCSSDYKNMFASNTKLLKIAASVSRQLFDKNNAPVVPARVKVEDPK